jgi:sporulation protein YabP
MNNEIRSADVPLSHEIAVKGRKQMSISGVREVLSFDESAVRLRTVCGELGVEGEGLRIGVLDTQRGVVTLTGARVDAVYYLREEDGARKGLLGKLFR